MSLEVVLKRSLTAEVQLGIGVLLNYARKRLERNEWLFPLDQPPNEQHYRPFRFHQLTFGTLGCEPLRVDPFGTTPVELETPNSRTRS